MYTSNNVDTLAGDITNYDKYCEETVPQGVDDWGGVYDISEPLEKAYEQWFQAQSRCVHGVCGGDV